MKLIRFEDYQIKVTDEALLIRPIRRMFNKDRSVQKERFFQQMSILYFMCDPISTYMYISDPKERLKEILRQEGLPEDYALSEELREAMKIYETHCRTSSTMLLEDTRAAVDKLRDFLKTFNPNERDKNKRPVYPINTLTSAIKQIPELAKSLSEAERAVQKELEEEGRARGGNNKTLMDDGDF